MRTYEQFSNVANLFLTERHPLPQFGKRSLATAIKTVSANGGKILKEKHQTGPYGYRAVKVELECSVDCCDDDRVNKALAELAKHTMFVKILGSYPNVNG